MRGLRRTRAIVGGLFALFTAFVVVIVGLSDSAGATAGSTAGAGAGSVPTTPPDLAGTVVTEHYLTVAGVVRTYRTIAPAGANSCWPKISATAPSANRYVPTAASAPNHSAGRSIAWNSLVNTGSDAAVRESLGYAAAPMIAAGLNRLRT